MTRSLRQRAARPPGVHVGRDALHPRGDGVRVHSCGPGPDLLGVCRQPLRALAGTAADQQGPAPRPASDAALLLVPAAQSAARERPQPSRRPLLRGPLHRVHHHDPDWPGPVRLGDPHAPVDDPVRMDLERDLSACPEACALPSDVHLLGVRHPPRLRCGPVRRRGAQRRAVEHHHGPQGRRDGARDALDDAL
jgi:hypothetical protein